MSVQVVLKQDEYNYLINELLIFEKDIVSKIEIEKKNDLYIISLDSETGNEIRELAGNEVGLHFDENYEPTVKGVLIEILIDKFYFD